MTKRGDFFNLNYLLKIQKRGKSFLKYESEKTRKASVHQTTPYHRSITP